MSAFRRSYDIEIGQISTTDIFSKKLHRNEEEELTLMIEKYDILICTHNVCFKVNRIITKHHMYNRVRIINIRYVAVR